MNWIKILLNEINNIVSSEKELRKFGLLIGGIILAAGIALYLTGNSAGIILGGIGIVSILSGLTIPLILLPFHKIWMTLSVILGFFMTRIILTLLFFLVVTPIGVIARLFGKDFLDEKIDRQSDSYWHYREKIKYEKQLTERQF